MRKIIYPSGTERELSIPLTIHEIHALIGADICDTVNLRNGDVMLVDDLGHKKNLMINEKATAIYHKLCIPGTTHKILGTVVIVPDADFGDE